MSRYNSLGTLAAEFEKHPGEIATITLDQITAGAMIRRRVRAAFDQARLRGADVQVSEQRGWLDSVFTARLRGTGAQLLPTIRTLTALEDL